MHSTFEEGSSAGRAGEGAKFARPQILSSQDEDVVGSYIIHESRPPILCSFSVLILEVDRPPLVAKSPIDSQHVSCVYKVGL